MKIFRYKLVVEDAERVLSIGVQKNKVDSAVTLLSFAYSILDAIDIKSFDFQKEKWMLEGRMHKISNVVHVPTRYMNSVLVEGYAKGFASLVISDIVSKFSDVKDDNGNPKKITMSKLDVV